jgi:cytoskeletal protein RodZ
MKKTKINLQEKQLDKLQEIGSHLRQVRTDQGLSIEYIAQKTCIPGRLLRGIEAGNMAILPEPVYIRGFIKQYADLLHLNGSELASQFPVDFNIPTSKSTIWAKLPFLQLSSLPLYFLYIVIVAVSVQGFSQKMQRTALELTQATTVSTQAEPTFEANSNNVQEVTLKPQQNPGQTIQPVTVDIKLKDQCWLRVIVDGEVQFEGVLPEGTHRTWTAREQLTVRAGNAGGVFVGINKEEAKRLGAPGQVQEVTYQAKAGS